MLKINTVNVIVVVNITTTGRKLKALRESLNQSKGDK